MRRGGAGDVSLFVREAEEFAIGFIMPVVVHFDDIVRVCVQTEGNT